MEKITAVIVDDEPEARELMKNLLSDFSDIEVVAADENVDKALVSISNLKPDLLFLDIDMPGKSGFDLVNELKSFPLHPTIVFVTAYNQFAIQAIKHAAFDYLVKPIDIDDLKATIDRYKNDLQSASSLKRIENLLHNLQVDKLRFSTRGGFIFIGTSEIIFCEAEGNYTDLHFANGEKQTITVNIGRLENQLANYKFKRINRSLIINQLYLTEVRRKDKICILRANEQVFEFPVSSKFLNNLFN